MIKGEISKERMAKWKIVTSNEPGFYEVASPGRNDCEETYLYRLNLRAGREIIMNPSQLTRKPDGSFAELELDVIVIRGKVTVSNSCFNETAATYDSFYITKDIETTVKAIEDTVIYIGGAVDEGYGRPFFRKFDPNQPIGDIHQIHGAPGSSGQREVFMTCGPEVEASRLIAGLTWSGDGTWTSWPPHQHEKELEETYCYFDMEPPHFGMQLSYITPGDIDNIAVHTVYSGVFVLAPRGYHPTVTSPGSRNAYAWIMCAHSHATRGYDLAKMDPKRENIIKCEKTLNEELNER